MAVTTTQEIITVIGVDKIEPESKKRRHRRSRKNNASDSSDGSTCSLSSDECKPRRRRAPRKKKTKNTSSQQQRQQLAELPLEDQGQYIALDCEMVGVGSRGRISSVARVTFVGWNGQVVFDEFVKQDREVTDYRTFVSGITQEKLESAQLTLDEVRTKVGELLEGKVLVGHALKNDMKALGITHPWFMIRDTAKYEPFMRVRFDDGVFWPRKLKDVIKEKLKKDIQIEGKPHCPCEDATAAMDLYRTVRRKWEKAMDYKIKKTQEIQMVKDQAQAE